MFDILRQGFLDATGDTLTLDHHSRKRVVQTFWEGVQISKGDTVDQQINID